MENIIIRDATIEDFEKVKKLDDILSFEHQQMRSDIIKKELLQLSKEIYSNIISSHNKVCFVAEYNKKIIAYCYAKKCFYHGHSTIKDMSVIELEKIYVIEKYRHTNIATKLFHKIVEFAKICNVDQIELSVWGWNTTAKSFYRHLGMHERYTRMEINV